MRHLSQIALKFSFATLLLLNSAQVFSQDWVAAVFPNKTHDFGTVAKGSKLRHSFKVVNSSDKEIHISGYRTKCGCTEVKIGAETIPPGTQTTIEATLDTTKFQGVKASGLTLIVDRPNFTEVDLNMNCFIRGDVLLTPGQVDFGLVNRADSPTQAVSLQYLGGNPDFKITGSQHISPRLKVKVHEQSRSGGQAVYQVNATLTSDSKVGFYKDQVTLKTNDPASPEIPIFVTATIQGMLTASPSVMNLGTVAKGATVQKTVIVKSDKPFKLTETKAAKGGVTATANPASANQAVQTLTITYKAPETPGPDHAVLELTSDIANEPPAKVALFATVGP